MNKFHDTIPVQRGPIHISADEAEALIRASWPRTSHSTQAIDYRIHTSECADVTDGEPLPEVNDWHVIAVLLALCVALAVVLLLAAEVLL